MSRWKSKSTAILIVLSVALGIAYGRISKSKDDYPLSVLPKQLEVGNVLINSSYQHKLAVANTSDQEIRITGVRASCGCTDIQPNVFSLAPNDTLDLNLRIDLGSISSDRGGSQSWPFRIQIAPDIHGFSRRAWWLTGVVTSPFQFEHKQVTLPANGIVLLGPEVISLLPSPDILTFQCSHDVSNLNASCPPNVGMVELVQRSDHGDHREYVVTFRPTGPAMKGPRDLSIRVAGQMANGQEASFAIPVAYTIIEDLQMTPGTLLFSTPERIRATDTIRARSLTGNAFYLSAFEYDASLLDIDYDMDRPDQIHVTLAHTPSPGTTTQILRFQANYPSIPLTLDHEYTILTQGLTNGTDK
jgi:hypothetical protein